MEKYSRRALLGAAGAFCAAGVAQADRASRVVDLVMVFKGSRKLYLYSNGQPVRRFSIDLGWAPVGHKEFEGDGRTPEGTYYINRMNPRSSFHLSLGISYPNRNDVANATQAGNDPGGDIFIHGADPSGRGFDDWTAGCIAVSNLAIEEIWRRVPVGTPIVIQP